MGTWVFWPRHSTQHLLLHYCVRVDEFITLNEQSSSCATYSKTPDLNGNSVFLLSELLHKISQKSKDKKQKSKSKVKIQESKSKSKVKTQKSRVTSQELRLNMSDRFQGIWRKFLLSNTPVSYTHVCVIL